MTQFPTSPSQSASPEQEACEPREVSEVVMDEARPVAFNSRDAVGVIRLYSGGDPISTHGTGWFIDDKHLVTNTHIVKTRQNDVEYYVWTLNQEKYAVELVDYAPQHEADVALLRLTEGTAPNTFSLVKSSDLTAGQPLIMTGHPVFLGKWVPTIGEFTRYEDDTLISDIPHDGGNSGSPLITLDGDVVGMHSRTWIEGSLRPNPSNPEPTSDTVYTEYPYQNTFTTIAEPATTIRDYVKKWR